MTQSPKIKEERAADTFMSQEPSSPEDLIESDPGMILMERTTPTKSDKPSENADEPQDLSVHKFHMEHTTIKEEEEESHPSSDTPMEEEEPAKPQQPKHTIPIPVSIPIAIQGLPFPYYFPSNLIHPFAGSLPVQITTTPPRQQALSPDIRGGSSAPGYMDTKLHRHLHRTAPYHKVGQVFKAL